MEFQTLKWDKSESILTITINRPEKLNALNSLVISELWQAIDKGESDPEIKGIILTGAGDKAFVAGADIAEFSNYNADEGRRMAEAGHRTFDAIENCSKPIVAAVNGFALGGGCELAMACHMRIASTNARFGQPEVNLGVIPGYGGTQRLIRLVGYSKAAELLLTGDSIKAVEAERLGLVNHIVEPEELLNASRTLLLKIADKSPLAVARILQLLVDYYNKEKDAFAEEITQFSDLFNTSDFQEGVEAFLQKRKAQFTGK